MNWWTAGVVIYAAIVTVLFFVAMSGIDIWKKRAENATRLLLEARAENLRRLLAEAKAENIRPLIGTQIIQPHNYKEFTNGKQQ